MKRFIAFSLIVLSVLFAVSCAKSTVTGASGTASDAPCNTVSVSVYDEVRYIGSYPNDSDITVFELFKKMCADKNIPYSALDGFINSIDGVDNSADSGWVYFFNGEMPDVGTDSFTVIKGYDNKIEFKYLRYADIFGDEDE